MIETNVTLVGFSRIDFDKKQIRKAMRKGGRRVQKTGRRLVSRRAISAAGEFPGRYTGRLWRSIKYKVSRSGFLTRIAPYKLADMNDFYPAYLFYGTSRGLKKRGNFMTAALEQENEPIRFDLRNALQDALIPR